MTQRCSVMKISVYLHVTWCSLVEVYQRSSKILAPICQNIRPHILDIADEGTPCIICRFIFTEKMEI
jgi:hypothetical protein